MSTSQFPSTRSGEIRVLTLNLWGRDGAWNERRLVLSEGFRALQPDLIALQETVKTDEYDQVIDLLGPDWNVVHQKNRDPEGMGISIASRWPLGEVQELDLHVTPRTKDFPCGTLVVEIFAPDPVGPLLFVNHFPNWQLDFEYEREMQTVVAARAIEERIRQSSLHVILAGDLDAEPDAASIRFWSGRQSLDGMSICYRDAWKSTHPHELGHTFTPENPLMAMANWDWPFRRIDYLFVRCGEHGGPTLKIASCHRIFDEPTNGVWASDHFGLVANLTLPNRK